MGDGLVCGIDVGGARKGFHLCVLQDQGVEFMAHARAASDLLDLLKTHLNHRSSRLHCIAIDGPARSFRTGEDIRSSEASLASLGYRILYTPREKPDSDHWMEMSASIHREFARAFPESTILETYPSAVADRLFGLEGSLPLALLQERRKRNYWMDYLDAYLCALSAQQFQNDSAQLFEDSGKDRKYQKAIALPDFPVTRATLSFILDGKRVLLGLKKKGFGAGYWNGFGGKIEPGETVKEAAIREIKEECGMDARDLKAAGKLYFHFDDDPRRIEGFLFTTTRFSGKPVETEEMNPEWYNIHQLPLNHMWEDDRFWLPYVLSGKKVYATFRFKAKKMQDYSLEVED